MKLKTILTLKQRFNGIYTYGATKCYAKFLNLDDLGFVNVFPHHDLCIIESGYNPRKARFANNLALHKNTKLKEFLAVEQQGYRFKEKIDDYLIMEKQ